jgi:hypothetical protein
MDIRILFLIVGLVLGGVAGYVTRPVATEINIGPLHAEVQSNQAAGARDTGDLTSGQIQHIAIYTFAGGILGALGGFLVGRRR